MKYLKFFINLIFQLVLLTLDVGLLVGASFVFWYILVIAIPLDEIYIGLSGILKILYYLMFAIPLLVILVLLALQFINILLSIKESAGELCERKEEF